jgi:hypothetical protein
MNLEIRKEHEWLQQLVGEWSSEALASMKQGEPPELFKGTENVRSVGGVWIVADGQAEMPGGGTGTMIMTLGFDPRTGRFVGSWVGSMMTHMWLYDGVLDAGGMTLPLEAEGPSMAGDSTLARYKDVIEIRSPDERVMTSHVLGLDGAWRQFMTATYRRKNS